MCLIGSPSDWLPVSPSAVAVNHPHCQGILKDNWSRVGEEEAAADIIIAFEGERLQRLLVSCWLLTFLRLSRRFLNSFPTFSVISFCVFMHGCVFHQDVPLRRTDAGLERESILLHQSHYLWIELYLPRSLGIAGAISLFIDSE